ncbi:VOC family protein [Paraglaciecola aquimarina]|uniref:VOC family protein n=1 Tax=Paraglaciecola algarum TaxID=3050085 RepID=A0ABS9D7C9_9ALTE|nr:VOC family protein [Paraglaciecola sp. G1-23]MCF2947917.1 VOC family protein [Paraglaciecola sp. G1-23]
MELGRFSVSLSVKDIAKSKAFYEALGFKAHPECGSVQDKWLILEHGTTIIGLFEGMFESNILTFNPTDARIIEAHLVKNGVEMQTSTQGKTGPAHCVLQDPDGNTIMFDQF